MRISILMLFLAWSCHGAIPLLSWPNGASNAGPYTLVSPEFHNVVFTPSSAQATENDPTTHKYNHHTKIIQWHNVIFIAHSSASTNEEDPGMQTAFEYGLDHGLTWHGPIQACPSQSAWYSTTDPKTNGVRICYPRCWAVTGTYPNDLLYLITAVDEFQTNSGLNSLYGAALIAQQVNVDGSIGSPFRISSTNYPAYDGKPVVNYDSTLGPPLMNIAKFFGTWGGSYAYFSAGAQSEWLGYIKNTNNTSSVNELNTFQINTASNQWIRIWRPLGDFFIYQQSSTDAVNWTPVTASTLSSNPAEAAGIWLSYGAIAICANPQNYPASGNTRDPLYLALADPSTMTVTNLLAVVQGIGPTPIYPGVFKTGGAQYPSLFQAINVLLASYSIHKESIGFSRIPIPGRPNDNSDGFVSTVARNITLKGNSVLQ